MKSARGFEIAAHLVGFRVAMISKQTLIITTRSINSYLNFLRQSFGSIRSDSGNFHRPRWAALASNCNGKYLLSFACAQPCAANAADTSISPLVNRATVRPYTSFALISGIHCLPFTMRAKHSLAASPNGWPGLPGCAVSGASMPQSGSQVVR